MPGVDYYLGPPLLALIRFGRWQEALQYPKPPDSFRYLNALWHYARSLALMRTGKLAAAEEELSQLTSFVQRLAPDAVIGNNSAVAIFAVAKKTLEGELGASKGNFDEAVRLLGEAVSFEDRLGYEEPPRLVPAGAPLVGGGAAQGGQSGRGRGGVPRRFEAKSREWVGALRPDEECRRSVARSGESALPQSLAPSRRRPYRVSVLTLVHRRRSNV